MTSFGRTITTVLVACAAVVASAESGARTRTDTFGNLDAIDTLYLWAEEGAAGDIFDFLDVTVRGAMTDWVVDISLDQNSAILYGTLVDAGTGLFDITYWYQNGTTPTFEYATGVWTSSTTFDMRTSGELERRGGWRSTGEAFSHAGDIVNPRAPAAVVPIPNAMLLLMSALSFLLIKGGLPARFKPRLMPVAA